ncbi:MAG: DNA alkylation repair protein [Ruminococcaceae bacterium]|nr:DNA alkylation repair protein [Oscillospiraceae bacterium]
MQNIQAQLQAMREEGYRSFTAKLIPTISKDRILGVRTPLLRAYAKQIFGSEESKQFLLTLPHAYLEENHLHAFLIEQIRDFEACVAEIEKFLPYIDNWATCDSLRPRCFARNKQALLVYISKWLSSNHCYSVRFAIEMLMLHFLDEDFKTEYAQMIAAVSSDEYYVNMMIAWYFATALSKHYALILPYLEQKRLPIWVHNKTIQKAIESYRITPAQKKELSALRRKNHETDH